MVRRGWLRGILVGTAVVAGYVCAFSSPVLAGEKGWHSAQRLTEDKYPAQQPAVYASGDNVHVVYRVRKQGLSGVYYLRSKDRGKTWAEPKRISGDHIITNYPAVFAEGERVYIVYVAVQANADSYQLFFTQSYDDGDTWPEHAQHVEGRNETTCFYPRIVKVPAGIGIIFCEEEQRLASIKQGITPEILNTYYDNPMTVLWPERVTAISRTGIKIVWTLDDAQTWRPAKAIGQAFEQIYNLSVVQKSESDIRVVWDTGTQMEAKKTTDAGERGEWHTDFELEAAAPRLSRFDLVLAGEDIHMARAERTNQSFPKLALRFRGGRKAEIELIPKNMVIRLHPRISYSDGDDHIVWSVQDREDVWINYLRTDRNPPESHVVFPTSPDITAPVFTVEWEGVDDLAQELEYKWRIGTDPWQDWTKDKRVELQASKDGEYELQLAARDVAQNEQLQPTSFKFNTFKVAPDTMWVKSPPATVRSRSVSVEWSGKDNATPLEKIEYQYRMDEGEWSPFAADRSFGFTDMKEGWHQLHVRSRDTIGNVDGSPLEAIFNTVLGIEVAIIGKPESYFGQPEASFQFDAKDKTQDNVQFSFQSRLDEGSWRPWTTERTATFDNISEGLHKVTVKARDHIENESTNSDSFDFTVDLTPPDIHITFRLTGKDDHYYPELTFEGSDEYTLPEDIVYSYRFADGEWSDYTKETVVMVPLPIKTLSWGYEVQARARDLAGNADERGKTRSLLIYHRYPIYLVALPFVVVGGIVIFLLVILIGKLFGGRRTPPPPMTRSVGLDQGSDDLFGGGVSAKPPASPAGGLGGDLDDDLDFGSTPTTDTKKKPPVDDDDDLFG